MKRKNISEIESEVLTRSRRRCCICFGLKQSLKVKKGQIAHLDKNHNNNNIDNLAFLCFDHHDQYDSKTSQSKGLKIKEVKKYREELYAVMLKDENSFNIVSSNSKENKTKSSSKPSAATNATDSEKKLPEYKYSNLFTIALMELPYVVILGGWEAEINEYRRGEVTSKTESTGIFKLPDDFPILSEKLSKDFYESKCRLSKFDCNITPGKHPNCLTFWFTKNSYEDYLRADEHLDRMLPDNSGETFRDKYAPSLALHDYNKSPLTNICGVGVFLITSDNKIIISKHSKNVDVYSGIWSYSASGTMDWSDNVHPFDEVARECYEEIGHNINQENLIMFGFGIDTKKLYYQFSFFEKSGLNSADILKKSGQAQDFRAEMETLEAIPFELDLIVEELKKHDWEPAAAASLLTLCTKRFGHMEVENAIDHDFVFKRTRKAIIAEWDERATRPGVQAVMSTRYPPMPRDVESDKYVRSVLDFIGEDIINKNILEVGAGIGRLTKHLVCYARFLTCLDTSEKMIKRNKEYVGSFSENIIYKRMFGQDYQTDKPHDIVISSLVLIHNVADDEFNRLTEVMAKCANVIFLFEHIDVGSQVSPYTKLRSREELCKAFPDYYVEKEKQHQLFQDSIVFMKLVKKQ